MKKLVLLLFAAAITASSFGQAENYLVEDVKAKEGSLDIPYKRYVLKKRLKRDCP